LTDEARAAGVLSDQLVHFANGKPEDQPDHSLRFVCVVTSQHTSRGKYGGGSTGPGSDGNCGGGQWRAPSPDALPATPSSRARLPIRQSQTSPDTSLGRPVGRPASLPSVPPLPCKQLPGRTVLGRSSFRAGKAEPWIGIGARVAPGPLPHHERMRVRTRRFDSWQ
jgi:hypothetical protein